MYATRAVNGLLAIHRDGQMVLSVCDQNWEFASWLCALLNQLGQIPTFSFTDRDREWLRAMEFAFSSEAHNA